ncbi:hypothetical protein DFH28DRAFT_849623, partial [Melampsora americana]
LIEVLKATLVPKSKKTSSIKVDVESAANILSLTGLIKEQASIDNARRITFEPSCRTVTDPASALTLAFELRVSTIAERVDDLLEHIAKLVSEDIPTQAGENKAPPKPSYMSVVSKHTPKDAPPSPSPHHTTHAKDWAPLRNGSCPFPDHAITLNQLNTENIAGAEESIAELIKILKQELKASKILLKPDDTSPIEVRNVHHHPSGGLMIYLDSQCHAQAPHSQE